MNPSDSPRQNSESASYWWSLFAKGMLMGAADVVPGVSGGTIAFITGIYTRLINALKTMHPFTLRLLFKEGVVAFWQAIDGRFLLTLFAGVLLSILSLAKLINYLLTAYPIPVWSFFFGLVLASAIYLVRQVEQWRLPQVVSIVSGAGIAVLISIISPSQLPDTWWMVALAGSIAVCAMILPGISGSFILLLMGMYTVVIQAISDINVLLIMSFAGGAVLGLLCFSHILSYLLRRFYYSMMALLTGFLIGSLNLLWPWKQVHETMVDRHGELVPLIQSNVLPSTYTAINDQSAMIMFALFSFFIGFLIVFSLDWLSNKQSSAD